MTNADYITINEQGVFVGGKQTRKYKDKFIEDVSDLPILFCAVKYRIKQEMNLDLSELHVLSSETDAKTGFGVHNQGNPSAKYGNNSWCRAKLTDGTVLPWTQYWEFYDGGNLRESCSTICRELVGQEGRLDCGKALRKAMFGTVGSNHASVEDNKKVKQIKLGRFLITIQRRQK